MISKSEIKLITSLRLKKYRLQTGLFVAEGEKLIRDLFDAGLKLHRLYTTETAAFTEFTVESIDSKTLQKLSSLKSSNGWLALFEFPSHKKLPSKGLIVALDAVRDPGNLGTIIRLCDWFGVEHLVCSDDTVDCFNPKVIQATMGSIARVKVHYTDLEKYLKETTLPIFITQLEGESIYSFSVPNEGILLMGSEAHGVHPSLLPYAAHQITIPTFSKGKGAESLNVATATAILLSEFRRPIER